MDVNNSIELIWVTEELIHTQTLTLPNQGRLIMFSLI